MVSAVRSRPNHYELLGVGPAASIEEISQAFARKMSLFGAHLMAEAPQISVAYETLRDPARRQAYDRTIGFNVGTEARAWGFTVAPPRWMPVVAPVGGVPPAPEPHVEVEPRSEAGNSRAAAIGESLRELARPERPTVETRDVPLPEPDAESLVDLYERMGEERSRAFRETRFGWKKPAIAAGGLLLGAGLIGGIAGFSVKDSAQSAKAEPALSVALPDATTPTNAPEPAQADSLITPELPRAAAASTRRRIPQPQRPTGGSIAWADDIAKGLSTDAPAVGQAAGDAQPTEVVQASLPISKNVIARTIERIGYRCGEVASTAPAGAGAFTVTCSSGQSYQARPVRGRYRFSRLGGG
ncbi:MAG: hypothetical protein JO335_01880 [Sphingomonas sp.]|nr:hypothetical protein [Sphingomonas sp.]